METNNTNPTISYRYRAVSTWYLFLLALYNRCCWSHVLFPGIPPVHLQYGSQFQAQWGLPPEICWESLLCHMNLLRRNGGGVGVNATQLSTSRGLKLINECPRLHALWWDSCEPHLTWLLRGSPTRIQYWFSKAIKIFINEHFIGFTLPSHLFNFLNCVFFYRQVFVSESASAKTLTCAHFHALSDQIVDNYFILFFILFMSLWY